MFLNLKLILFQLNQFFLFLFQSKKLQIFLLHFVAPLTTLKGQIE